MHGYLILLFVEKLKVIQPLHTLPAFHGFEDSQAFATGSYLSQMNIVPVLTHNLLQRDISI